MIPSKESDENDYYEELVSWSEEEGGSRPFRYVVAVLKVRRWGNTGRTRSGQDLVPRWSWMKEGKDDLLRYPRTAIAFGPPPIVSLKVGVITLVLLEWLRFCGRRIV